MKPQMILKQLTGRTLVEAFALLSTILAICPIPGVCADAFDVRPIVQIPTGGSRVLGVKELDLSKYLGMNDRLVLSQKLDADEPGHIYLNFDRVSVTGWREVPEEKVFEAEFGRAPEDSAELKGWRERRSKSPKAATDVEKRAAWESFRDSKRQHPGFEPVEERRPLFIKLDTAGKVLDVRETPTKPARSGLSPGESIPAETLAWFRTSVSLSEFRNKREKIEWKDQGKTKSVERTAEFTEGMKLGEDGKGNTVFLMRVTMPFLRPHSHGTSDSAMRVYVVSPDKSVLQSTPAYPGIRMHARTHDLYELFQGAYEGLMPALDDPKVKPLVVRVWKAR
jgi:hypothetical protein